MDYDNNWAGVYTLKEILLQEQIKGKSYLLKMSYLLKNWSICYDCKLIRQCNK